MNIDIKQLRENIHSVVSNLQALGEVEDGREELAKLQREFEVWQRNTKLMRGEFDEVKRAHDKLLKEAWDKQHEVERAQAELKRITAEIDKANAMKAAIIQQFQRVGG